MRKINPQALAYATIVLIAAATFLTFDVLFSASTDGDYPREILAALVGTLMAAVITTLLLRHQSAGEEAKERNVEVFKQKIAAYDGFIESSMDFLADRVLTAEEAYQLRRRVYRISLLSSAQTVETATNFLRSNIVDEQNTQIFDVIKCFRSELKLDPLSDESLYNMEAVDVRLAGGIDDDTVEEDQRFLSGLVDSILSVIEKRDALLSEQFSKEEPWGANDGAYSSIQRFRGTAYYFTISYGNSHNKKMIDGYLDLAECSQAEQERLHNVALSCGFGDDDETTEFASFLVSPESQARRGSMLEKRRILTMDELADAIIAIEHAADMRKRGKPEVAGDD